MLNTIDILLGITVIMLIASMAVTVLTQSINSLLNLRGRHLWRGLGDLIQQIDPKLERAIVDQISNAILTHPMISHVLQRRGDTIHREEFTKFLMDLAAGDSPDSHKNPLPAAIVEELKNLLQKNGIDDPAATLDKVRNRALQLEMENPELAANVRSGMALMQEANSRLIAKINSWFDLTVDRVSDRFTASTRLITVVCSIAVVLAMQLDTIDIINRLSMDDGLRSSLVSEASHLLPKQPDAGNEAGNPEAGTKDDGYKITKEQMTTELDTLKQLGVINVIDVQNLNLQEWCAHWHKSNPFGIILSVFLLSLGAPFWYGTLKNLLKLRGVMAGNDDMQRRERQTSQSTDNQPTN